MLILPCVLFSKLRFREKLLVQRILIIRLGNALIVGHGANKQ